MTAPAIPPLSVPAPPTRRLDRLALWQIDALGLAACAGVAALWYLAGLQPLQQARAARAELEAQYQERSQEADQLNAERASLQRLRADKESVLERSPVRLIPPDQVNERVAGLTALAQEQKIRLDEIKPGARVAAGRFTTVPMHLSGAGSYAGCAAFLHAVRDRFPDVGLTAMDLRGEPEAPDRSPRFVFDLVWYAAPTGSGARK